MIKRKYNIFESVRMLYKTYIFESKERIFFYHFSEIELLPLHWVAIIDKRFASGCVTNTERDSVPWLSYIE